MMAIRRVRCGSSVYVQKKSWASVAAVSLPESLVPPADLRCLGVLVTVAELEDAILGDKTESILGDKERLEWGNGGAGMAIMAP